MRKPFSSPKSIDKQLLKIHILTAMFNLSNMALYVESPNEFPEHYGLTDHRLSEFSRDNGFEISIFTAILFFTVFLGISNQKSYCHHIGNVLSPVAHSHDALAAYPILREPRKKPEPKLQELILSVISAAYKTAVSSSSLAALIKTNAGSIWAILASVLCAPGNFMAQFAIFAAPIVEKYHRHLSPGKRFVLSHLLTLCYNIPNVALYFNQADGFLKHVGFMDHRLSELKDDWEFIPLFILGVCSVSLFLSTQRSYSEKVERVFKKDKNEESFACCPSLIDKIRPLFNVESRASAVYKTAINYISLVSVLYSFRCNVYAGFLLAAICIPGNLAAQFSVLKSSKSQQARRDELFESSVSVSHWFGFFERQIVIPPQGLGHDFQFKVRT